MVVNDLFDSNCSSNSSSVSKSGRKNVSFVGSESQLCIYYDGAVMEDVSACRKDIWYQHTDLAHIKRKAMVVSKEAHRYGFGSLLTNTYGRSCDETQDALNTWVCNGNSRRGLERWINDEYAAKRADIRRRTIQSVLRAQSKMKEEGITDYDYANKVMARLSEAFSIDSRNFARSMGVADELAAVQEAEPSTLQSQSRLSSSSSSSVEKDDCSHKSGVLHSSLSSSPVINNMIDPRKMLMTRSFGPRLTSARGMASAEPPRLPHRRINIAGSSIGSSVAAGEFRHFY